jgi:hypothetical protein
MVSELVKPHHLDRRAVVYVRQSTPHQVLSNQESLRLQYALRQRARDLGWREADIEVVDADLGLSGASAAPPSTCSRAASTRAGSSTCGAASAGRSKTRTPPCRPRGRIAAPPC